MVIFNPSRPLGRRLICVVLTVLLTACESGKQQRSWLQTGMWRFELALKADIKLPVMAELRQDSGLWQFTFRNAAESIVTTTIPMGDSIRIQMPVFDSEFKAVRIDAQHIRGEYHDYVRGDDYVIPFEAVAGIETQFEANEPSVDSLPMKWETTFSPASPYEEMAIGLFEQEGSQVTGTFRTPTGDYRYLSGALVGSQLKVSAFDGAHVFLFTADLVDDGALRNGKFYSGNHYETDWVAVPNPAAVLPDPDTLTYLLPEKGPLAFSFPNLAGDTVVFPNEELHGKVVIVQLLGSWCPNCMDESRLFAQWYDRYHEQGLEIIGLAFERSRTMEKAVPRIQRMKENLGVDYPILVAALTTSKKTANEKLPMLNHVLSYPTSIYIDRSGQVRRIHTGFNGPGTGHHYDEFVATYERLIESMLAGGEL